MLLLFVYIDQQRSFAEKISTHPDLYRKIWSTFSLVFLTGQSCFGVLTYWVVKKWGDGFQLNTGYVLLFMTILWILHIAYIS